MSYHAIRLQNIVCNLNDPPLRGGFTFRSLQHAPPTVDTISAPETLRSRRDRYRPACSTTPTTISACPLAWLFTRRHWNGQGRLRSKAASRTLVHQETEFGMLKLEGSGGCSLTSDDIDDKDLAKASPGKGAPRSLPCFQQALESSLHDFRAGAGTFSPTTMRWISPQRSR